MDGWMDVWSGRCIPSHGALLLDLAGDIQVTLEIEWLATCWREGPGSSTLDLCLSPPPRGEPGDEEI